MELHNSQNRFLQLSDVLSMCSNLQEKDAIFTIVERIFINQERGRLLAGNSDYNQNPKLELKIQNTILKIRQNNCKPQINIEYD
jgi:hypothetical protein